MLLHRTRVALPLLALLSACSVAPDASPADETVQTPPAVDVRAPLSDFARFVGGEWRMKSASGAGPSHAWQWGPGQLSLRRMTHAAEAGPNPWAGEVVYWHPEHAEIRCLSLHGDIPAVGRGVAGGTIRFEGEITVATIGLDQPRGPRKLGQRQIFAGPDEYREVLLEDSGSGFQQLAAWDFVRVPARSAADVRAAEKTRPALPEAWRAFEPLVNTAWEAHVDAPTVMPARVRSRFEWNADLETLCVQITRHMAAGLPSESIDAYVYRDVATPALRCLALSDLRGVHEGSATVLDDGAIELELKGYDGERVVSRVVRLEIEPGAQLRARCWTVAGSVRTLALDVRHEPLKPN